MFLDTSYATPIIDRQPSNKEELKIEGMGKSRNQGVASRPLPGQRDGS